MRSITARAAAVPAPAATRSHPAARFRWKLLGDQEACRISKDILGDRIWNEAAVQNEAPVSDPASDKAPKVRCS